MDKELQYIRVNEAARLLSVSRDSIRRRIARGQLTVKRLGTMVLIPSGEIERMLMAESEENCQ